MQKKMFRDAFEKAGINFDEQVIPLDLRAISTEQALDKVKEALAKAQARTAA
jgi:hypothetical protein